MPRNKAPKSRVSSSKRMPAAASAPCLQFFTSLSGYVDGKLQKKICADLNRHLGSCDACLHFLQSLRDTVSRIEKQSSPGAAATADIRRTILAQYRAVMKTGAKFPPGRR